MHQEGQKYQRAFLSYAHEDRIEVLKAAQLMHALKISYFQDLLSESPGDRWRDRLHSEIDKSDVFLLFWSRHAQKSKWVIEKSEYALQRSQAETLRIPLKLCRRCWKARHPPSPKSLNDSLQRCN